MKRIFISLSFVLVVLSGCNNGETASNYYLFLSGESDHWKLNGYEIVMTPVEFKAGNGTLTMKGEGEHMTDFFSYHVYTVVDGEEISLESGSESGATNIAEQTTGTIESEGVEENLTQFQEVGEIYMDISWYDNDTDRNEEERIVMYNKGENGETFLNPE